MRTTLLTLVLCAAPLTSAQHEHHSATPDVSITPRAGNITARAGRIADVPVQTHDGRALRFHTDLVKGRITAINFIFTSCTTVCPLMGVQFAQLQSLLPKEVSLVSISIDPANDTPARLKAWSQRVGAKPGWTLVTGAKNEMDTLLRSLGTAAADPATHTPLILIVDERVGHERTVQRMDGLSDPKTVLRIVNEALR